MNCCLIAVLAVLGLALPTAAQAAPIEREHYSGSDSFDILDCALVVHDEVTFEGVFMLKAPREEGGAPYYFDNYEVHETLTAMGKTLTIDHQGIYKDLHITQVEGTVYQFVGMEAGQPFVVRDGDGNLLIRDRGLLRTTFQVDTLGDTDLDNDVFVEGSFSLLADRGSHPGFYLDFCDLVEGYFLG